MMQADVLEASCHCGAVRITIPRKPEYLIECSCSICRRNGALWAFYEADSGVLHGHPESKIDGADVWAYVN
jgi:hypothetical protein